MDGGYVVFVWWVNNVNVIEMENAFSHSNIMQEAPVGSHWMVNIDFAKKRDNYTHQNLMGMDAGWL